jgi:hypothetical protein
MVFAKPKMREFGRELLHRLMKNYFLDLHRQYLFHMSIMPDQEGVVRTERPVADEPTPPPCVTQHFAVSRRSPAAGILFPYHTSNLFHALNLSFSVF